MDKTRKLLAPDYYVEWRPVRKVRQVRNHPVWGARLCDAVNGRSSAK